MTYSTQEDFKQPDLQFVGRSKGKLWGLLPGRRLYRLAEDYIFEWGPEDYRRRFRIPAGYVYDKASTPVLAEIIGFIPDGEHEAGALIHDRLYQYGFCLPKGEIQVKVISIWVDDPAPWSRAQADDMLEYMAILGGMSPGKAWIEKEAVQLYPPNWFKRERTNHE